MRRYGLHVRQRALLPVLLVCLWNGCRPSETTQADRPTETPSEEAWVEGLQAARQERASLTKAMEALLQVSLSSHEGPVVELTLTNLGDRNIAEYGGLLHLRDAAGERVCTLWLSEQQTVPTAETQRRLFDVEGAFATDSTPASELQPTWAPYRIVFDDGEVMAKPWPTQSWWPWCQSYLSAREE